ncbi:putative short-chain dehydrogenase [metagenome]|uniref:Putative short-chain dehydrogenase n=1 Tax=metagenome TaxID=256318 RepID=A0A2P2CBK9_9ZZZZ
MDLTGKVVVVTGAARGQGAAEVEALARAGARVVATDVLDEDGAALAASLSDTGLEVGYRHLDVTSPDDWAALAASLDRVDGLINNAGIAARERLPHVTLPAWQLAFDINVTGPMLGIQALVPLMVPGASIVNVCSVAAMAGHAAAAYTSSKWALRGLTRTASLELGARGIRVNAVMPGLIETPLMESASPAFRTAALAEIPLGRTGQTADIAPTMVFLMSDDSAYYNGAEIVIDGGLSAHVSHKGIADATRPPADPSP